MEIDWDERYRRENTPWEKGAPAPPLLEWLAAHPDAVGGAVLVPGCGLGHDVRALAALDSAPEVLGVDIARAALERAARLPRAGRERYLLGDFFALPTELHGAFDWVWEHTCFCAIDPALRDDYVSAAAGALKPGGSLLGVFFLDPYDEEHRPGEGPPHGASVEELRERFEGGGLFRLEEGFVPSRSYPGRENCEWIGRFSRTGASAPPSPTTAIC